MIRIGHEYVRMIEIWCHRLDDDFTTFRCVCDIKDRLSYC